MHRLIQRPVLRALRAHPTRLAPRIPASLVPALAAREYAAGAGSGGPGRPAGVSPHEPSFPSLENELVEENGLVEENELIEENEEEDFDDGFELDEGLMQVLEQLTPEQLREFDGLWGNVDSTGLDPIVAFLRKHNIEVNPEFVKLFNQVSPSPPPAPSPYASLALDPSTRAILDNLTDEQNTALSTLLSNAENADPVVDFLCEKGISAEDAPHTARLLKDHADGPPKSPPEVKPFVQDILEELTEEESAQLKSLVSNPDSFKAAARFLHERGATVEDASEAAEALVGAILEETQLEPAEHEPEPASDSDSLPISRAAHSVIENLTEQQSQELETLLLTSEFLNPIYDFLCAHGVPSKDAVRATEFLKELETDLGELVNIQRLLAVLSTIPSDPRDVYQSTSTEERRERMVSAFTKEQFAALKSMLDESQVVLEFEPVFRERLPSFFSEDALDAMDLMFSRQKFAVLTKDLFDGKNDEQPLRSLFSEDVIGVLETALTQNEIDEFNSLSVDTLLCQIMPTSEQLITAAFPTDLVEMLRTIWNKNDLAPFFDVLKAHHVSPAAAAELVDKFNLEKFTALATATRIDAYDPDVVSVIEEEEMAKHEIIFEESDDPEVQEEQMEAMKGRSEMLDLTKHMPMHDPMEVFDIPPTPKSPFHNRVIVRNHVSVFDERVQPEQLGEVEKEGKEEVEEPELDDKELRALEVEEGITEVDKDDLDEINDDAEPELEDNFDDRLPMVIDKEQYENFFQKVLMTRRVTQQTGKGKIHRISFMVLLGNQDGIIGVGEGKHEDPLVAHNAARLAAIKNLDWVERFEDRTVWTDMETKFGGTRILMRPRPMGFGLRCNPHIHEILRAAGFKDISAKVWGSRNKLNVIKATVRMLQSGHTPVNMGDGLGGRGKKLSKGSGMVAWSDLERARGRKLIPLLN